MPKVTLLPLDDQILNFIEAESEGRLAEEIQDCVDMSKAYGGAVKHFEGRTVIVFQKSGRYNGGLV